MPKPRTPGGELTSPPKPEKKRAPAKLTGPGRSKEPRPKLPAAAQFVFVHHPGQWQVQKGKLVPCLSPIRLHAGLHGTRVAKNGEINARTYLGKKLDEGWLVLDDYTATEDGEPYALPIINDREEEVWISRWEQPVPGSDAVVADEAGYVAWLEWLLEQEIIPPIRPHVLEALEHRTQAAALDAQQHAKQQVSYQPRAERLTSDLEVIRRYREEMICV